MHRHESEILTITFLMLSAVSFGLILRWIRQPPLVGYILARLALGAAGLGLVDYTDEISSIAEFDFVLTASGVASGIFTSFEADFLLAVIAASLFLSPLWSWMLHYLVIRYRIHDPVALLSKLADPE